MKLKAGLHKNAEVILKKTFTGRITKKCLMSILFLSIILAASVACLPLPGISSSSESGDLKIADSGPITLDPGLVADLGSAQYVMAIFSGLVKLDQDLKIVPDIAERWEKNPDGTVYTFYLRNDAVFQSGKNVKASDFKYSWERVLNPATGSLTAGTYLNDIAGSEDVLSGKTDTLSGVKVIDDYTLQVTIDAPKAYFLDKMAYPTAFVVDRDNVKNGSSWWQKPNGTGPFKLAEWQKDTKLVLERNEKYYGEKAGLERIIFYAYIGDPLLKYQSGDVDVAPVAPDYIGLVTDPSNPVSEELSVFPELSISYIGFNTVEPPFDDVNVRQAFSYAVDKERVNELATSNTVTTAYGFLPPGIPGYNADLEGLAFNPEKAKDLLAKSKYGGVSGLPDILITTPGWAGNMSGVIGGVIAEWRRNLGVEVRVRQLEPEIYYYRLHLEKNNMFDWGWIADYPDPHNFLDVLFHTGEHNNTGEYSNPDLDKLLDSAAVEQDTETRMKMYQEAERIIVNDAAALPVSFGRSYFLIKPFVKNYYINPLGIPLLYKVTIE